MRNATAPPTEDVYPLSYVGGVADGGERCREKISRPRDGKRDALGPS